MGKANFTEWMWLKQRTYIKNDDFEFQPIRAQHWTRNFMTSTFWFGFHIGAGGPSYLLGSFIPHFLFFIVTVWSEKMFLAVSRDSSTDKHNKRCERLNHSKLSDKRRKRRNFNHKPWNGPLRKILTFCQFPDLPIEFCDIECSEHLYFGMETPN